jgi:hypothetical protein
MSDAKEHIRKGLLSFVNDDEEGAKVAFNKALEIKMQQALKTPTPAPETKVTEESVDDIPAGE